MPNLFEEQLGRTGAIAAAILAGGYYATKLITSTEVFHLTQASIAILAVSALIVMVTMHHRRDAQFLTQRQEEMLLVGGMALIWVAVLIGWRAFRGGAVAVTSPSTPAQQSQPGHGEWECGKNDVYCVVEEYSYF